MLCPNQIIFPWLLDASLTCIFPEKLLGGALRPSVCQSYTFWGFSKQLCNLYCAFWHSPQLKRSVFVRIPLECSSVLNKMCIMKKKILPGLSKCEMGSYGTIRRSRYSLDILCSPVIVYASLEHRDRVLSCSPHSVRGRNRWGDILLCCIK